MEQLNTVLVIDDDHDIRVSLRDALESEGYYVFSAANGIDGMAMLTRIKAPCVILLDQNMPLMNGDQFLEIKNADEKLASIPVIVMSAVPNRSTYGVSEFVGKPFDILLLIKSIRKFCNERSSASTL